MIKRFALAFLVALVGHTAQAQLFSGGAVFSAPAFTQLGPITNNTLTITNTANGFIVTGQVDINVLGPAAGILLSYTVDRPLNPTYGTNTLTTMTQLDGFSLPPIGLAGNTSGNVKSEFTNVGTSTSSIPITLTAGAATWIALSNTSAPFLYTSTAGHFLRQEFVVDGVYQAGPGGIWTVDVPVTTTAQVPEPTAAGLGGLALGALLVWRRRRR
jgi:MYXO-CTERM domain-containing protein